MNIVHIFVYRNCFCGHCHTGILLVRAPGHLQLDLLAVFDVTFEGLIDQQSVTEDSTRPSFFEHA